VLRPSLAPDSSTNINLRPVRCAAEAIPIGASGIAIPATKDLIKSRLFKLCSVNHFRLYAGSMNKSLKDVDVGS